MKIYHGNFVCSKDAKSFAEFENSYISVDDSGVIVDISTAAPADCDITELGGGLVITAGVMIWMSCVF